MSDYYKSESEKVWDRISTAFWAIISSVTLLLIAWMSVTSVNKNIQGDTDIARVYAEACAQSEAPSRCLVELGGPNE